MTSAAMLSLGASSTSANWDAIDWQPIEANVRRLQMRIAKATREGRWGKGQGPAMASHPLVLSQALGRAASRPLRTLSPGPILGL